MKKYPNKQNDVELDDNSVFHAAVNNTLNADDDVVHDDGGDDGANLSGDAGGDADDFSDDGLDDYEIIFGEEPESEPEPDKLDPNITALVQTVGTLAETLKPAEKPIERKQRAVAQQIDEKKLREDFNKQFHETDDPFELVKGMANTLLVPALSAQSQQLQQVNKSLLMQDDKYAFILNEYEVEVENMIADLPPQQQTHPDAYKYAADRILLLHIDEYMEHKVNNNAETKHKQAVTTRPGKTRTVTSNQRGTQSATNSNKPKVIRATEADKRYAKMYGMSIKDAVLQRRRSGK